MDKPFVSILMGSDSDLHIMDESATILKKMNVNYEKRILSAHRTPNILSEYLRNSEDKVSIYIVGAGVAAHLAGFVAAHTTLPVIGVPIDSSPLNGVDSLYSTVQMPAGIPVATMAIGVAGAKNAALFAISILSLSYSDIKNSLIKYRDDMTEKVIKKDEAILLTKSTCNI